MTSGGKRSICDALVSNPFIGIAPLRGTNLYSATSISAFNVNRTSASQRG